MINTNPLSKWTAEEKATIEQASFKLNDLQGRIDYFRTYIFSRSYVPEKYAHLGEIVKADQEVQMKVCKIALTYMEDKCSKKALREELTKFEIPELMRPELVLRCGVQEKLQNLALKTHYIFQYLCMGKGILQFIDEHPEFLYNPRLCVLLHIDETPPEQVDIEKINEFIVNTTFHVEEVELFLFLECIEGLRTIDDKYLGIVEKQLIDGTKDFTYYPDNHSFKRLADAFKRLELDLFERCSLSEERIGHPRFKDFSASNRLEAYEYLAEEDSKFSFYFKNKTLALARKILSE